MPNLVVVQCTDLFAFFSVSNPTHAQTAKSFKVLIYSKISNQKISQIRPYTQCGVRRFTNFFKMQLN